MKTKTKRNISKKNGRMNGGKVVDSGGFGCVFIPSLKCVGDKTTISNDKKKRVSKLMLTRYAKKEYNEIQYIKDELSNIPNSEKYFLVFDATICKPKKIKKHDLLDFNLNCRTLFEENITSENINDKKEELMILNLPNGGVSIDQYLLHKVTNQQLVDLNNKLIELLKFGILPMNKKNIYHSDIKSSNVLIDDKNNVRLIDWGISVTDYNVNSKEIPNNWFNRPLQFNVPFSVILFNDIFQEMYNDYLTKGGGTTKEELKPFVLSYLKFWMKKRGSGHYKVINQDIYHLYETHLSHISEQNKPIYIETQITLQFIIDYITHVLVHFTDKTQQYFNSKKYLNEVYTKIVDIYGFISIYLKIFELLYYNIAILNANDMIAFHKLRRLFFEYLYKPRDKAYDINQLVNELKELNTCFTQTTTTSSSNISTNDLDQNLDQNLDQDYKNNVNSISKYEVDTKRKKGGSIRKTRRHTSRINTRSASKASTQLFRQLSRKQPIKRFKNPFFLQTN